MQAEWFKDWFDSPYYHILYKNRDHSEAVKFIETLSTHLQLQTTDEIWDLACGKGRHSIHLNKMGFKVTGTDLSKNNIACVSSEAREGLEFYEHDMRTPFRMNYFTHVLNLFTSIGYFDNDHDTLKVFKNVFNSLKPGGRFVLDFFNSEYVTRNLTSDEEKSIEGVSFRISKRIHNNRIVKRIDFTHNGIRSYYEEKVSLYRLSDFENFALKAGFKKEEVFGSYDLDPFNASLSERLIMIFKK